MKLSAFAHYPNLKVDGQLTVNSVSQAMRRAVACGVNGLEYSSSPVEELDVEDIQLGMRETGAKLSIIGSYYWVTGMGMNIISEDEKVAERSIQTFLKALEIGAKIGTPVAIGQIRGNVPDTYKPVSYYEDRLVETLRGIAAYAKKTGAAFTIEPENRFFLNWLNTSDDCARIIDRVGYDGFQLTLDLKHMNVEEDIIRALIVHRDITHNIHFIDADNTMFTRSRRFLDIERIIQTLCAIQFRGWLCIATSPLAGGSTKQDKDLADEAAYIREIIARFER